jgi:hypothetical protein
MSLNKRLINVEGPQGVQDGFSSVAYDGNSSSQTLNTGLQSGIFWARSTTTARNYFTYNISGGNPGKYVVPSSTQIEEGTGSSISYNSTGIGLTYSFGWNYNSISYLGLTWGFPTSGSTNSNGSITTTTYADQTLGQSMFTYTGTGSNATIGHGLSSTPEFVVIKTRSHVSDWPVYHSGLSGNNYRIRLNSDAAEDTSNNPWNSTAPTSSVISIKGTAGNVNQSSRTFWGWAFHSVANHCKVGTYTGSGSSQTINIGFQPNHVWIKRRNGTDNWAMFDSNRTNKVNYINADTGEESFTFGFASNGFTVPSTSGMTNGSGQTYLYCAWKHSI